ncbi:MAG TPA: SAM-dependent methyltransferase [Streptosporangiaceae bacterium]|nr:SAM-dependent methyltransferase [Streptosporangiaceae bacterium]
MTVRNPLDLTGPNIARVYDVLAGGYDNFAADQDKAGRLLAACPGLRDMVRDNRAFLGRAVTWAASQGIAQFLDLGTGLPLRPGSARQRPRRGPWCPGRLCRQQPAGLLARGGAAGH